MVYTTPLELYEIVLWVLKIVYLSINESINAYRLVSMIRGVCNLMSLRVFFGDGCTKRRLLLVLGQNNFRLISYHRNDYELALKLLEITKECEEPEIRKAYLDKARIYHPDSLQDSADPKQFAKVTISS